MLAANSPVKTRLLTLLDELISHDGYGSLKVEIRLMRRGQKEIIIDAGKQYRYVVDFNASPDSLNDTPYTISESHN